MSLVSILFFGAGKYRPLWSAQTTRFSGGFDFFAPILAGDNKKTWRNDDRKKPFTEEGFPCLVFTGISDAEPFPIDGLQGE